MIRMAFEGFGYSGHFELRSVRVVHSVNLTDCQDIVNPLQHYKLLMLDAGVFGLDTYPITVFSFGFYGVYAGIKIVANP